MGEVWQSYSDTFPRQVIELIKQVHLVEHYAWADGLANHYADNYRSAFLVNYCAGALAVVFAFASFALEKSAAPWSLAANVMEFLLILLIVAVYCVSRSKHWHERWIDYRLLAEHLRQNNHVSAARAGGPALPARSSVCLLRRPQEQLDVLASTRNHTGGWTSQRPIRHMVP